jgi:hypothetical protein
MSPNPLTGIVPKVEHRNDADQTAIVEQMEKIEGEVGADAYIKALISAPEVEARITELENCLQRLANAVMALDDIQRHARLRDVAEQAAIVLKNRLEVDDLTRRVKQNVRGRLRRFLERDKSTEFADGSGVLKL